MRTSSEKDVEEEEVQEDNTVRKDWILVLQKSKRRPPVIGESSQFSECSRASKWTATKENFKEFLHVSSSTYSHLINRSVPLTLLALKGDHSNIVRMLALVYSMHVVHSCKGQPGLYNALCLTVLSSLWHRPAAYWVTSQNCHFQNLSLNSGAGK